MSIRFQVAADGYDLPEWSDGQTVIPIVDQHGQIRVNIDGSVGSLPGPALMDSFDTHADYAITSVATHLSSLPAVSQGILVTALLANTKVVRVSGVGVTTTKGQPLAPGSSFVFPVSDADILYAVTESGTQYICVSAV